VAGYDFDLTAAQVGRRTAHLDPEPIHEHYVVVGGRRYPPKQVLAAVTGLDRADFTTHQARAILRRLGFGVYRLDRSTSELRGGALRPHRHAEGAALAQYQGRWVAQSGLEVLFDADSREAGLRWLRRHHRKARVCRVPGSPSEAGSALSTP